MSNSVLQSLEETMRKLETAMKSPPSKKSAKNQHLKENPQAPEKIAQINS